MVSQCWSWERGGGEVIGAGESVPDIGWSAVLLTADSACLSRAIIWAKPKLLSFVVLDEED